MILDLIVGEYGVFRTRYGVNFGDVAKMYIFSWLQCLFVVARHAWPLRTGGRPACRQANVSSMTVSL